MPASRYASAGANLEASGPSKNEISPYCVPAYCGYLLMIESVYSNVNSTKKMFYHCESLRTLNLTLFD